MAVNLSPVGGVAAQFFDNSGNVLTGGKIYTYAAGTTTPATTYTTNAGNINQTNPIVLDASGRVSGSGEIWLTDSITYKFVLKDSNDVLIATYDNIIGINSNFVNFVSETEIQTATAGQTVFNLTTMQYQPGTNNLLVFVDGVNQYEGSGYSFVETDSTTVTFVSGLHVGAEVKFTTATPINTLTADAATTAYTPPFPNSVTTNVQDRLAEVISVKDFGAVGDGVTDDTEAIKNAIALSAWTFNTNTVLTESTATPVAIFFPTGTYRITEKIKLAPGLQFIGESGGIHARTMEQTNLDKKGTTLYFDYEDEIDYAIDTSGFAGANYSGGSFTGQRIDNYAAAGGDTAGNIYAFCPGLRFQNINIQAAPGNLLRGLNLAGAPMLVMENVQVHGFIVGIRLSASWGGQLSNVRIDGPNGWRPLVLGTDNNNTTLTNVYISGQNGTGSTYTPPAGSTIGDSYWTQYEGTPATYSWITRADLELSHGLWCRYARPAATSLTIEACDVGIGLRDSNGDFDGVYMEGIVDVLVADYGSGYGSKIDFAEVRSCSTADVIWGVDSFTDIHLPETVDINTVIGGDNVGKWSNPYVATAPVVTGRNKSVGETIPSFAFQAYNDGILFTPNKTASTTISGAATYYDSTDGLIIDNREVDDIIWQWRGAERMSLTDMLTSPTLRIKSDTFKVTTSGGSPTISTDTDGLNFQNNTYGISFIASPTVSFHPGQDNAISLGRSGERWSQVYAANGTINTSDANKKQQIRDLSASEKLVAARLKNLIKAFKFNDAVAKKGDSARTHIGVIAQEVKEAFLAEGLDAHQYGVFCYDKWDDEFYDHKAELDKDGNVLKEAWTEKVRSAGESYGVRYEQLLAFVISAL